MCHNAPVYSDNFIYISLAKLVVQKRDSVTTEMPRSIHNWDNTVLTHFEDDIMYQINDQFVCSFVQESKENLLLLSLEFFYLCFWGLLLYSTLDGRIHDCVATLALADRRSNYSARSHPKLC
jgi:hypothetical protein